MWNRYDGYRRGEREMRGGRRQQVYGATYRARPTPGYGYDRGYAAYGAGPRWGYGRDYWWIGEHAMPRTGAGYDDRYRRFAHQTRPRFSPVGGMYPPVGGWAMAGNTPEPLREHHHFSDWTRWF